MPYLVNKDVERDDSDEAENVARSVHMPEPRLEVLSEVEVVHDALRIVHDDAVGWQPVHGAVVAERVWRLNKVATFHVLQIRQVDDVGEAVRMLGKFRRQVGAQKVAPVGDDVVNLHKHPVGHASDDAEGEGRQGEA